MNDEKANLKKRTVKITHVNIKGTKKMHFYSIGRFFENRTFLVSFIFNSEDAIFKTKLNRAKNSKRTTLKKEIGKLEIKMSTAGYGQLNRGCSHDDATAGCSELGLVKPCCAQLRLFVQQPD